MATDLATSGYESGFLRSLEAALMEDIKAENQVATKVGVLLAAGHTYGEIAKRLELTPKEVHNAMERLKRVKPQPERYAGAAYLP